MPAVVAAPIRRKTSSKSQQSSNKIQQSKPLFQYSTSAFSPAAPQAIVKKIILEIGVVSPQIASVVQTNESPNIDPIVRSALGTEINTDS